MSLLIAQANNSGGEEIPRHSQRSEFQNNIYANLQEFLRKFSTFPIDSARSVQLPTERDKNGPEDV